MPSTIRPNRRTCLLVVRTRRTCVYLVGHVQNIARSPCGACINKEGLMRTLAHGLPSRPLGAHLAVADVLSGGCCWSSSTRPIVVEVYTSVSAGRTVPGARRVRICVLFNVIVPYTRGTSLSSCVASFSVEVSRPRGSGRIHRRSISKEYRVFRFSMDYGVCHSYRRSYTVFVKAR